RDRAQAVVSRDTPAESRLEPPLLEVDVVVDEERPLGRRLVEAGRSAYRAARLVHVRLGLQEREPLLADARLGDAARELPPERAAVAARELVGDEPADVVARPLV